MRFVWAPLWAPVWAAVVGAAVWDMDSQDESEAANRNDTLDFATTFPPFAPPNTSPSRPADCADHLIIGKTTSGVYEIFPFTCSCSKPVLVWCDMETDGGGWTVFLSRQEVIPQLDFNRTWKYYKTGFGSPYNEYYMGNEILHVMTQTRAYTLRLDIIDTSGGHNYATFQTIRVNDEDNKYKMYLTGSQKGTSSITSCFRYLTDRYFTTIDRDHDHYSRNCATRMGGGWWFYNTCINFNPTRTGFNHSMPLPCYSSKIPVTKLQLKIRPQICDTTFKTIHLNDLDCGCQIPE